MELERCYVNGGHVRQPDVSGNGVVSRWTHYSLHHGIAPGHAGHELRKGFLFIRWHQDFRFPGACALD